jgi:hypothetical protein
VRLLRAWGSWTVWGKGVFQSQLLGHRQSLRGNRPGEILTSFCCLSHLLFLEVVIFSETYTKLGMKSQGFDPISVTDQLYGFEQVMYSEVLVFLYNE